MHSWGSLLLSCHMSIGIRYCTLWLGLVIASPVITISDHFFCIWLLLFRLMFVFLYDHMVFFDWLRLLVVHLEVVFNDYLSGLVNFQLLGLVLYCVDCILLCIKYLSFILALQLSLLQFLWMWLLNVLLLLLIVSAYCTKPLCCHQGVTIVVHV